MGNVPDSYQKLILLMMRAKRHSADVSEQLGLTPVQGMLIIMFAPGQARSMNDLSCRMGCDASNTTGLIDRLDAAGLVKRTVDPNDRRVKMITLSKKGVKLREQLIKGLREAENLDLSRLSTEEQAQFIKIIDKLTTK